MVICRALTGAASKTRMRFKHPIDPVGGPLVGLIAAWVLASFTLATLHTSPMAKEAFGGKLVYDAKSASVMTQPDARLALVLRKDVDARHAGRRIDRSIWSKWIC